MQKIEYTFSPFLIKLMQDIDLDVNLFYTEDYVEIIKGIKKYDDELCSDTSGEELKMLIYVLKNKNVKFTNEYFLTILEIMKLSSYNGKANNFDYNSLVVFLSLDYDSISFLACQKDKFFLRQLLSLSYKVMPLLIDIYVTNKQTHSLFEKLKKYNPLIIDMILENGEMLSNIFYQSEVIVTNKLNALERYYFMMAFASFIENIKELNYKYTIISDLMLGIKFYLLANIEKFEFGVEEHYEQTFIIKEKIDTFIENVILTRSRQKKLN